MTMDSKIIEEHMVDISKGEWTKKDKENVLKDAKVIKILFNILDSVLINYILSCKIANEVWDRL